MRSVLSVSLLRAYQHILSVLLNPTHWIWKQQKIIIKKKLNHRNQWSWLSEDPLLFSVIEARLKRQSLLWGHFRGIEYIIGGIKRNISGVMHSPWSIRGIIKATVSVTNLKTEILLDLCGKKIANHNEFSQSMNCSAEIGATEIEQMRWPHLWHFILPAFHKKISWIECDALKVCSKIERKWHNPTPPCPPPQKKLCPIGSAQGGPERLQPAVSIAPANHGLSPGAGEAPSSAGGHASCLHLARRESWLRPIAWRHKGNKVPKIGARAGNGFYWRTNQGGRFSGAQFRFWLDSYWHQGYQCVSYWEV